MAETDPTLGLATRLAPSFGGNNKVARDELLALIGSLHEALAKLASGEEIREPAVPIDQSVKRNEIIRLECGKGQKTLKRHLSSGHGLTAEECRTRWGLGRKPGAVRSKRSKARRKR